MNQPCPDCGTLMLPDGESAWQCPACGHKWTDGQIKLLYAVFDDDYNLEVYDEDCDDCGDYDDTDDYYQAYGWRYNLRTLHYRLYWWLRRHIQRCPNCKKRLANCECIPF